MFILLFMLEAPRIVKTTEQQTVVIPFTVSRQDIRQVMGAGYNELMAAIAAQGLTPAGPWFTHHFRMNPETFDFEIGVPITRPVAVSGRVKPGRLPATIVARTVHHGGYEGLGAAWGAFAAWIKDNGHTPAPDLWECYNQNPDSNPDPADCQKELNRPLLDLQSSPADGSEVESGRTP